MTKRSYLVLSLDFELFWGVYESRGAEYFQAIEHVHQVVPRLLELFDRHGVACTWATVGALMADDEKEFLAFRPDLLPNYESSKLSPYGDVENIASVNKNLLFAPDLIRQITKVARQEIGSHTFSHYYSLEAGQSIKEFRADLDSNMRIASKFNLSLKSFVFPRNQVNQNCLAVCLEKGITAYRGNPKHWAYSTGTKNEFDIHKRIFRYLDSYIPLSGPLVHQAVIDKQCGLFNVPASLFFRPYNKSLKYLEPFKVSRIKYSMRSAAKYGKVFHLWWHPHNFSKNTEENLAQLEHLLSYFKYLKSVYGMESVTMSELVSLQGVSDV